jgi:hypothetical protein
MNDKPKIVKMSDHDDRAITWGVKNMLEDAIKAISEEPKWSKKAIVIFLDDSSDNYHIRTMCAGISKTSEVITLLDVAHYRELKSVNG